MIAVKAMSLNAKTIRYPRKLDQFTMIISNKVPCLTSNRKQYNWYAVWYFLSKC